MVRKRIYGNKKLSFTVLILVVVILVVVGSNIYYSEIARNIFFAPGTFSYTSHNITSSYNTGEEIK